MFLSSQLLELLLHVYQRNSIGMEIFKPMLIVIFHLTYSPLLFIRWEYLSSSIYFFCNKPIWLAHHSKKMELWRLPRVRGSNLKFFLLLPLAQVYRWKEDNICQSIWDQKWSAIGNSLGTCQELGNSFLWPPPYPQEKREALHSMTRLLIGCMEILFLKLGATILAWTTLVPSWPLRH